MKTRILFPLLFLVFASPAICQSSDVCLACHGNDSLKMTKGGRTISLYVDAAHMKDAHHASMACVDCHSGLNPAEIPHAKPVNPVQCQNCHPIPDFEKSAHGIALGRGEADGGPSAACKSCHGTHEIRTPSKKAQVDFCLKCHQENPKVVKQVGYSAAFIGAYKSGIHGMAIASGNPKAPSCADCHGAHDAKRSSDPSAPTARPKVAQTCARCHAEEAKAYNESIHGTALKRGIGDAPTCTTCHGEHQIQSRRDPGSRVAHGNVSEQVCATCHKSVQLNAKFGMSAGKIDSFSDSYHGLALKSGAKEVANCASCHGVHNIKPSSDPTSTISRANLPATCGRCHPGANGNFAKGPVHVVAARNSGTAVLYWIRIFYIALIIATVGGMLFHNALDFLRKAARRLAVRSGKIGVEQHLGIRQHLRMTLNERVQHAVMFTSFIVLVITGFMLKFPDAWWVIPVRHLSERFFAVRSIAHRIAGIAMIAISLYHVIYLFMSKRGRQFGTDMLPKWKDIRDVWANLKYLLRLSEEKPLFDRFGYIEKAEYWALVWGVIIMAGTGVIMWFDNYFMGLLTKLGWDISRSIHFYEACLATLAILVWHFYYVIFNPDTYPMNTAWFTGKVSEEEMAEEHPLELERIKASEQ